MISSAGKGFLVLVLSKEVHVVPTSLSHLFTLPSRKVLRKAQTGIYLKFNIYENITVTNLVFRIATELCCTKICLYKPADHGLLSKRKLSYKTIKEAVVKWKDICDTLGEDKFNLLFKKTIERTRKNR